MKTLKGLFYTLFSIVLIVSCSVSKKKGHLPKGNVIITGQLISDSVQHEFISLKAGNMIKKIDEITFCDSSGKFQFEFKIIRPQVIHLIYETQRYPIFVNPQDSLFVTINKYKLDKAGKPSFKVSGPTAQITEDIQRYNFFEKTHHIKDFSDSAKVSIAQYYQQLNVLLHKKDSVIDEFVKYYHPSEEVLKYIRDEAKYRVANSLIYYKMYHDMNAIPVKGKLFNTNVFPVNNDDALISSSYQSHIWQYVMMQYISSDSTHALFKTNRVAAYKHVLKKILSHEKPGLSRDFMYYKTIGFTTRISWDIFDSLMNSRETYRGNKVLFGELKQKLKRHKEQGSGIVLFSKKEMEITGNFYQDLIWRYHGKVIYLNFWETNCGPCLGQIPYEIKLHSFFKDKSAVQVSVCLNSYKENWLKLLKEMHVPGKNYFLSKKQSKIIAKELGVHLFPTYMIIDKKGRIIDKHAPWPKDAKQLKGLLSKYMKE